MSAQLGQEVEKFLTHLRDVRGYAALSLSSYERQLTFICRQLEEAGIKTWAQLTVAAVENLLLHWRRAGAGASSVNQRLAALRSFCDFLVQQGQLQANPAKVVKATKSCQKRLPKNLDIDAVIQLLEIDPTDELAIRDRAMFELLYSSGLRFSGISVLECGGYSA